MTTSAVPVPLLQVARGKKLSRPPVWLMRQAGRYLPEYRAIRAEVGDFLQLCYTPELAAEVTLQPLRRFDLDAAILFSDILVVPHSLGRNVRFEVGEGPVLDPIDARGISALEINGFLGRLAPVLEAVRRVKSDLPPGKALIGFAGAPWTVATYMIGGRGSPDQAAARLFALREPKAFADLMDRLVEATAAYLVAQLRAGADVVQIFESWALNLDEPAFAERVIGPTRRLVELVRREMPGAPIIGFPRGAAGLLPAYVAAVRPDVLGLDYAIPAVWADGTLPSGLPVQGNLDPLRLLAGGSQLDGRVGEIIAGFGARPHIFNLGHGILPETPIAHVERLVALVKGAA